MVGSEEVPRHDDLEDIEILSNLLELRARLGKERPHLESDLD